MRTLHFSVTNFAELCNSQIMAVTINDWRPSISSSPRVLHFTHGSLNQTNVSSRAKAFSPFFDDDGVDWWATAGDGQSCHFWADWWLYGKTRKIKSNHRTTEMRFQKRLKVLLIVCYIIMETYIIINNRIISGEEANKSWIHICLSRVHASRDETKMYHCHLQWS